MGKRGWIGVGRGGNRRASRYRESLDLTCKRMIWRGWRRSRCGYSLRHLCDLVDHSDKKAATA